MSEEPAQTARFRAILELDTYWGIVGLPSREVVERMHAAIANEYDRSLYAPEAWKHLLDEALNPMGYRIGYQGQRIEVLVTMGDPPGR